MFLSDRTMTLLIESGLPAEKLVAILQSLRDDEISSVPARQPSRGAERQRRYRERHQASPSVTSDADVTEVAAERHNGSSLPPLSPTPPNPSNLSPVPPIVPQIEPLSIAKPNGFAKFWELYPAKVGKRAAERSFAAAVKRADTATIFAGLERSKRCRKWRDGFIPNPTTWLNQDRWLDEPDFPDRPRPPHSAERVSAQEHARRLAHYRDTREWKPGWGERPKDAA